jgi:hypothetical protein
MVEHKSSWTLVDCVFKWLTNYTTDRTYCQCQTWIFWVAGHAREVTVRWLVLDVYQFWSRGKSSINLMFVIVYVIQS